MTGTRLAKYPYARTKGMSEFMEFARDPDWKPSIINAELLTKLSIGKGKEREAIHALKFLGIISADGTPTDEFDNLKTDYPGTMKRLVPDKYADLFSLIPARLVNQDRLVKFFGQSADTSEYQGKLLAWFCEQAGIELPNLEKHFHRSRRDKKKSKELSTDQFA
jgi:hypothetical protein